MSQPLTLTLRIGDHCSKISSTDWSLLVYDPTTISYTDPESIQMCCKQGASIYLMMQKCIILYDAGVAKETLQLAWDFSTASLDCLTKRWTNLKHGNSKKLPLSTMCNIRILHRVRFLVCRAKCRLSFLCI